MAQGGAGSVVRIDGVVKGPTFATGQDVQINGTIEGDLFTAAQNVAINGKVTGNIYSAGQTIRIGIGAFIFVLTPFAIVFMMITIIGIPLGVITGLFYGIFIYISKIIMAVLGATILSDRYIRAKANKGVWEFLFVWLLLLFFLKSRFLVLLHGSLLHL